MNLKRKIIENIELADLKDDEVDPQKYDAIRSAMKTIVDISQSDPQVRDLIRAALPAVIRLVADVKARWPGYNASYLDDSHRLLLQRGGYIAHTAARQLNNVMGGSV